MRFGPGISLSVIMRSKVEGETPEYAAASALLNIRRKGG